MQEGRPVFPPSTLRRTSNTQVQQKVAAGVQALQTELVRPACAATAVHTRPSARSPVCRRSSQCFNVAVTEPLTPAEEQTLRWCVPRSRHAARLL